MNPRKTKDLLPQISQETNLPLDFLEDLHDFYWKEVHKTITSLEHLKVRVNHLGTFGIKGDIVVQKEIDRLSPLLGRTIPGTPSKYMRYTSTKTKVDKLTKLRDRLLLIKEEKEKYKVLRNEIRSAKETLEGQKPDH